MDATTRYSVRIVCSDMSLAIAIHAFEIYWIIPFWGPRAVQGDGVPAHVDLVSMLAYHGIEFRPVPPRRTFKNVLEYKHGALSSIFVASG